jgi:hypothetical protein
VIRTRPVLGALVTTAAAAFALAAYGGSSEGTVVAKTDQGLYDYACHIAVRLALRVGTRSWDAHLVSTADHVTAGAPEAWPWPRPLGA